MLTPSLYNFSNYTISAALLTLSACGRSPVLLEDGGVGGVAEDDTVSVVQYDCELTAPAASVAGQTVLLRWHSEQAMETAELQLASGEIQELLLGGARQGMIPVSADTSTSFQLRLWNETGTASCAADLRVDLAPRLLVYQPDGSAIGTVNDRGQDYQAEPTIEGFSWYEVLAVGAQWMAYGANDKYELSSFWKPPHHDELSAFKPEISPQEIRWTYNPDQLLYLGDHVLVNSGYSDAVTLGPSGMGIAKPFVSLIDLSGEAPVTQFVHDNAWALQETFLHQTIIIDSGLLYLQDSHYSGQMTPWIYHFDASTEAYVETQINDCENSLYDDRVASLRPAQDILALSYCQSMQRKIAFFDVTSRDLVMEQSFHSYFSEQLPEASTESLDSFVRSGLWQFWQNDTLLWLAWLEGHYELWSIPVDPYNVGMLSGALRYRMPAVHEELPDDSLSQDIRLWMLPDRSAVYLVFSESDTASPYYQWHLLNTSLQEEANFPKELLGVPAGLIVSR